MGSPELLITKTAIDVISTFSQVDARNKQARYQEEIARQQAEYQRQLAESRAATLRRRADRELGRQAAKFAGMGMDVASDSALLTQQALAGEAEIEALQMRNSGLFGAASLDNSANLTRARASSAAQRDYLSLGTRLLGSF